MTSYQNMSNEIMQHPSVPPPAKKGASSWSRRRSLSNFSTKSSNCCSRSSLCSTSWKTPSSGGSLGISWVT